MVYWPKPLYDLYLRTASMINCNVLPGGDKENYIHSKPNCSLLICIQRSSVNYHKRNLYLFKRCRLTYPDVNITSRAITKGSHFPITGDTTQCTTVLIPYQNNISLIGAVVLVWTCFPPTLSYNHPLTVWDAQFFIFLGVNFYSILIIKIIFYEPSVSPLSLRCNNRTSIRGV